QIWLKKTPLRKYQATAVSYAALSNRVDSMLL
ncbi:MAG: hypothetical protein ACI9J2_001097, partial [Saprospiraceae bacterium]